MTTRVLAFLLLLSSAAVSQEPAEQDHALILEIGGASESPIHDGTSNFGGTLAAEITPIERWLELESGITVLSTAKHSELSADLLFKKPFRLSSSAEFMAGLGPSVSRTMGGPERGTALSLEAVLDFMFWPSKRVGWYIEPGWSVSFRKREQFLGATAGLLLGFD